MKCNKRLATLVFSLIVLVIVGGLVFRIDRHKSFSMASTVLPDDLILSTRFAADPDNGEVILYKDPTFYDLEIKDKPLQISRLYGLPGDLVELRDKEVIINEVQLATPRQVRRIYRVVTDGTPIDSSLIQEFALENPKPVATEVGIFDVWLDTLAWTALQKAPNIKNLRATKMYKDDSSSEYWPYSGFYPWNRDQMGPLTVPYAGMEIDISLETIDQYRDIIENHEGNEVLIDFRGVQINGHPAHSYTFTKDYLFVLDDNRDHPNDSRKIGFIPKDHLIGKAKRILWSPESHSFFKAIRTVR